MSFDRPDLATLLDRARTDIESRLEGADAGLRRSVLGVLATMHAGAAHGLYGYLDYLSAQLMPDTAEVEYLDRWAGIWKIARTPAAKATGTALCSGTSGAVLPAGALLRRADAVEYEVTVETALADGAASVPIRARVSGASGNADAGAKLSLASPVPGVQSVAVVEACSGGADAETDASLRARLLARIRQAPHGGADFDYAAWALAVPGVTRVWVSPLELGAGTVTVRIMTDETTDDGIPTGESVALVQAALDAARPVTADLTVAAPTPAPLNPQIALSPDTSAVRAAVQAELLDLLRREARPGGTILVSHLREAVSIAAGENDHVLVSPAADVAHATGEIATLGAISWGAL
jgi:uncharacterized phage protein gp47/JayE